MSLPAWWGAFPPGARCRVGEGFAQRLVVLVSMVHPQFHAAVNVSLVLRRERGRCTSTTMLARDGRCNTLDFLDAQTGALTRWPAAVCRRHWKRGANPLVLR
jgi:hypothetical protein